MGTATRWTAGFLWLFVLLAVGSGVACTLEATEHTSSFGSEFVLTNAAVYTVNPRQPRADAVAVRDGIVVAVGAEEEVLSQTGPNARVIDLRGRIVLPGFQDSHVHAVEAGVNRRLCFLRPSLPLQAYERIVRRSADTQRNEPWVRGAGVFVAALLGGN